MAIQSQEDILRTADDWFRNFCPSNLVKDGPSGTKNAELIMGRCLKKHGILTISGMTEAAFELGAAHLALIPEPPALKVKTADELTAAEIAKQHRDYMDSIRPQESFDAKVARDKQKRQAAEWAKGQEQARAQLGVAILDYACYRGPNQADVLATEAVQRELKEVRAPAHDGKGEDGKNTDYIATTAWVRAVIAELPDHPRLGDAESALKRVRENVAAQQGVKRDKNQGW
jgi:hypothetical protein